MRRTHKILLAGVAACSAIISVPATASAGVVTPQAHPSGCTYSIHGAGINGASAKCSNSNGGHYKALVICEDWDNQKVARESQKWVSSGYSYVSCPPMTKPTSAGIMTKAS
ncbi:hypothetical protein JOC24_006059 [Streptomyces sp. HB132]|nr:hypothetical protein [Streptomyces sp. HB132]